MERRKAKDRYWVDIANLEVTHGDTGEWISVRLDREASRVVVSALQVETPWTLGSGSFSLPFGRWLRLARWSTSGIVTSEPLSEIDREDFAHANRVLQAQRDKTLLERGNGQLSAAYYEAQLPHWVEAYLELAERYDRLEHAYQSLLTRVEGATDE